MKKTIPFTAKLIWILDLEDRNPSWLSRKLDCSHTLCYDWIKGKTIITNKYRKKIRELFGDKYDV